MNGLKRKEEVNELDEHIETNVGSNKMNAVKRKEW